ncbi:hypothetical protein [Aliidiomarina celeris]|nr:hypothetical protein [Aliidiomarina celeris]
MNLVGLLLLVALPVAVVALLAFWLINGIRKAETVRQREYTEQKNKRE